MSIGLNCKYELRNRNQRFLCYSLSCGDILIHKNSSTPDVPSAEGTLALRDALRTPSPPGALAKQGESRNVVKDRMAPRTRQERTSKTSRHLFQSQKRTEVTRYRDKIAI